MSRISLFGHSTNPRSSSPGWGSQRKRSLLHIDTHRTLMNVIMFLFVMLMITAPVSASSAGRRARPAPTWSTSTMAARTAAASTRSGSEPG